MFADTAWRRVGTRWTGTLTEAPGVRAEAHWLETVRDPTASVRAGHLEGMILEGIGKLRRHHRQLVILTPDGTIAGLAEYSYISPLLPALSLRIPSKRGFDGYVRDFVPNQEYVVAAADFAANAAIELLRVAPFADPQPVATLDTAATTAAGNP